MEEKSKEFEQIWEENKSLILMEDEEYNKAVGSYKINSGADWLLWAIPAVAGIVSMQFIPISSELLKWTASIAITILVFALCVYVKSIGSPHRSLNDIESDVKERNRLHYMETGQLIRKNNNDKS